MSLSLLRLSTRAHAYHSALNELSQLAADRGGGPAVLTDALGRLVGPLSLARASRLQLVVTDLLWQKDVEPYLRSAAGTTFKDYLQVVRSSPTALTGLPGYWRVRNRIVRSIQSDQSTFASLFQAMLAYLHLAQKEASEDRSRASLEQAVVQKLLQKQALLEEKIQQSFLSLFGREGVMGGIIMIGTAMLGEGNNFSEQVESDAESAEDFINQVAACMAEAGKRRAACHSQCLSGPAGSLCRSACEVSYLLDIAGCALS